MSRNVVIVTILLLFAIGAGIFIGMYKNNSASPNTQQTIPAGGTLNLSDQKLTALPATALSQTGITSLNLSNNQLTSLPADIAKLQNLEILNIENNRITSLPPEIMQLTKLRQILANNNRMTSVIGAVGNMNWLNSLDISGNNIPTDEIAQLKISLPNTQIKE